VNLEDFEVDAACMGGRAVDRSAACEPFGGPAVSGRPVALRPRLAAGLPVCRGWRAAMSMYRGGHGRSVAPWSHPGGCGIHIACPAVPAACRP